MGVLKDFNTTTVQREQAVDDTTTRYNIIRPGVSYSGFCTRQGCEGYRKQVICNRGIGSHLVNDDIMNNVPSCPCCRSEITIECINVFRCKAVVTVHDQVEEKCHLVATGNEIVKLGQRSADHVVFSTNRLVTVDASELDRSCCMM